MEKTLTILGPTASGKTTLAIELAKVLNGEIVGLDSRQIYKGMSIGTAQPTEAEMAGVPHYLISIRRPSESISAGEYVQLVEEKIMQIKNKGKRPIICGGSGLYFRALNEGIFKGSTTDTFIRKKLEKEYSANPIELLERLKIVDPDYAEIVHLNNKKRLIRALEIYEKTGKPISEHFKMQKLKKIKTNTYFSIFLNWERSILKERIRKRTKNMLRKGWIDEVKSLMRTNNCGSDQNIYMDSIGYKFIESYLMGQITKKEMEDKIVIKTNQFSRRQKKWFEKENIDLIIEMDNLDEKQLPEILHCFLKSTI